MNDSNIKKLRKFRFAVVGNGLIGSAAGRYLSEWCENNHDPSSLSSSTFSSSQVVIIGPSEENNNNKVYSSHYDQGRLCSMGSRDPVWNVINKQAILNNYAFLQERSGIKFHGPVGKICAFRSSSDKQRHEILKRIERRNLENEHEQHENTTTSTTSTNTKKSTFQYYKAGDRSWKEKFPMLEFSSDCDVLYESDPAGYINPRQLIHAQNEIAQHDHNATIISEIVVKITSSEDNVQIILSSGEIIIADKVLIACGAFTNFQKLLPKPIPLRFKTESMVWGTVSSETAEELISQGMPTVVYDIIEEGIDDPYMAPPLLYPDGTYKIKMGCNTAHEKWPTTLEQIQTWFQESNDDNSINDKDFPAMVRALQSQLPNVKFLNMASQGCIVTYTPSGYPTIDIVPSDPYGRLFVASGGNGTGAQGSDTLGHIAARLMFDGRWMMEEHVVPRQLFQATNQWDDNDDFKKKKLSKAQERAMALQQQENNAC